MSVLKGCALWLIAGALVVSVSTAALAYWRMYRVPPAISVLPEIKSLAVLPLENRSGDPAQDYFADGMAEALIAGLAKVGAVRVSSLASVLQYQRTRKPLADIARELNVDAVVGCSVLCQPPEQSRQRDCHQDAGARRCRRPEYRSPLIPTWPLLIWRGAAGFGRRPIIFGTHRTWIKFGSVRRCRRRCCQTHPPRRPCGAAWKQRDCRAACCYRV